MSNNNFNFIFSPTWFYNSIKPKQQKQMQQQTYFNLLFNILTSMFTYSGFNENFDEFDTRYIDTILCSTGSIACGKINNKLTFAPCTLGGEVDAYGLGHEVVAPTPVGDIRGVRNKDVAYGINNNLSAPDTLIYWISYMMSECDTSSKSNILYSRLLNIPIVNDEKQKDVITQIYKKLLNGEDLTAVVSSNIFDSIDGENVHTIELTDTNKIDRIQYLSRFYDDLLKRFCNFYGQALQTQNKSAQTQSDELHGMDSFSFIIPLEMLRHRKQFVENINRIFDTNITVEFSDSWKYELVRFETRDLNENGVADVDELDSINDKNSITNKSNLYDAFVSLSDEDKNAILDLITELKGGKNNG